MLTEELTTPAAHASYGASLERASDSEDPRVMDQRERIACAECAQTKPAQAFYLIRGPLAYGDWRAQPCADCCHRRVNQTVGGWR